MGGGDFGLYDFFFWGGVVQFWHIQGIWKHIQGQGHILGLSYLTYVNMTWFTFKSEYPVTMFICHQESTHNFLAIKHKSWWLVK